ncbi:hypothetical protein K0P33_08570 [Pseudomonas sp. ArH3a]|uniref:hypothetical protein n=1 Tax=Pseudomonas sp. ArH3a TaxID=2862945 RepID=UPI001F56DD2D|nr:hypothetical protein [Pseudomonas sp. ArH3a]UNM21497.1 hypothetical protein K0P33_08570 [Pseudomonas sp. ArH3a]
MSTVRVDSRHLLSKAYFGEGGSYYQVLKREWIMSFGSGIGSFLTTVNKFSGELINADGEKIALDFDSVKLSYIEDYQFSFSLGLEDNPGSKNELTLEAGKLQLEPRQTYPIGPKLPIKASFGWEGYIEYLPPDYSGSLSIEDISEDENGKIGLTVSFSLYYGEEMEVKFSTLKLST